MKNFSLFCGTAFGLAVALTAGFAHAQKGPQRNFALVQEPAKPSPAATATGKVGGANVTVNYSSPAVKGRSIWGGLVPYGEVWRAGANEATTVVFSQPVKVEGKALAAGTYSFFAIPGEKEWTIIFNKEHKQWGAYEYKQKEDALRVTVKPRKAASASERLTYSVTPQGLLLRWENLEVPVTIK